MCWPPVFTGELGPAKEAAVSLKLAGVLWTESRQEAKPLAIAHTAQQAPQQAQLSFPNTTPAAAGAAPQAATLPGSPVPTFPSLSCGLDGISLSVAKPGALVFLGCAGICRQSRQGCTPESARLLHCG